MTYTSSQVGQQKLSIEVLPATIQSQTLLVELTALFFNHRKAIWLPLLCKTDIRYLHLAMVVLSMLTLYCQLLIISFFPKAHMGTSKNSCFRAARCDVWARSAF